MSGVGPAETYELLDYYEARRKRWIEVELNSFVANDEKALATAVIQRLKTINPFRERYYQEFVSDFFNEQQMITGVQLTCTLFCATRCCSDSVLDASAGKLGYTLIRKCCSSVA